MAPEDPPDPADRADPDVDAPEPIQLSIAQVAASSLAAVSAAVVCSYFGVAGTFIGAAIASVCATVGSALYAHSLRRTQARLRRLHRAGAAAPPLTEVVKTTRQQGGRLLRHVRWSVVALGALSAFVFSMEIVSVIELNVGKSVAAVLGVSHSGSRETTINSLFGGGSKRSPKTHPTKSPTPSPTDTQSPSPSAPAPTSPPTTPTTSPTATPTTSAPGGATSPPSTTSPTGPPTTPPPTTAPTG